MHRSLNKLTGPPTFEGSSFAGRPCPRLLGSVTGVPQRANDSLHRGGPLAGPTVGPGFEGRVTLRSADARYIW